MSENAMGDHRGSKKTSGKKNKFPAQREKEVPCWNIPTYDNLIQSIIRDIDYVPPSARIASGSAQFPSPFWLKPFWLKCHYVSCSRASPSSRAPVAGVFFNTLVSRAHLPLSRLDAG